MEEELETTLAKIEQNEPYIAKLQHDQYYVVAEKAIITENTQLLDAIINTICAYFAFNIAYPKGIYPLLIFLQRYVTGIKDQQEIPSIVKRVLTSLAAHTKEVTAP